MEFLSYLDFSSLTSACIVAVCALFLFKRTTKTLRILSVFVLINIILEIVAVYIAYKGIPNVFMFHIHTAVEFVFVILLATKILETPSFKIPALILTIGFIIFCIIDALYIEGVESINFIPRGIEGLVVIGACVYFFYKLFTAEETLDLLKYPYFWLFAGWLIYFSGTFFLFVYNDSDGFAITFPIIHPILNIFLNLVYTYTLWLGSRKLAYR